MQMRQVPNGLSYGLSSGSIPESATCGWASAHSGLISLNSRVRHPDPPFFEIDRVRKLAKRSRRERGDFVGSTPTSVTDDRVVQRQRRLGDNQEIDGSIPSAITFENGL